jgi:hypothetical protein
MRSYSTASGGVIFVPDHIERLEAKPQHNPVVYTEIVKKAVPEVLSMKPLTKPKTKTIIDRLADMVRAVS